MAEIEIGLGQDGGYVAREQDVSCVAVSRSQQGPPAEEVPRVTLALLPKQVKTTQKGDGDPGSPAAVGSRQQGRWLRWYVRNLRRSFLL